LDIGVTKKLRTVENCWTIRAASKEQHDGCLQIIGLKKSSKKEVTGKLLVSTR
jgi:hypothetical protein